MANGGCVARAGHARVLCLMSSMGPKDLLEIFAGRGSASLVADPDSGIIGRSRGQGRVNERPWFFSIEMLGLAR